MQQQNKKITFLQVLFSQLSFLFAGAVFISIANLSWSGWSAQPWQDVLFGIVAALVTYGLMYLVYLYGGSFAARLLVDVQKISQHFVGYSWLKITCVALLAGVGEELLFRIALQGWLSAEELPLWLAIFAPALLFGLLHFISWPYFILATFIGIVFGVTYHLSQSAALVMIWHAIYDLIALGVIIKYPQLLGLPQAKANSFTN